MELDRGTLRLVVGDQLSLPARLSSLRDLDPTRDVVLMAETMSELTYVRHHKQKVVQTLSAMRRYADALAADGVSVRYVRYDDPANTDTLPGEVARAVAAQPFERVVMTRTGEWRLEEAFDVLEGELGLPFERREERPLRLLARRVLRLVARQGQADHGVLLPRDAPQDRPAHGRRQARRRALELRHREQKRLPAAMRAPDRVIIARMRSRAS